MSTETTSETGSGRQPSALRWYHTIDLPGGATPGEYDLRPIVDRLPWPADMTGMRCIDIGSRDGFYAFEMERRGASEVVSVDIDDPSSVHFPGSSRPPDELVAQELTDGHRAFATAREELQSKVERRFVSIYDLGSSDLGTFDFAVIGTLLLHLRDPVQALQSVRGVVRGRLLLNEVVVPGIDALRRRPIAHLYMEDGPFWWVCNRAGLERLAKAGGFEVERAGGPYFIPNGSGGIASTVRSVLRPPYGEVLRRLVLRRGAPHAWFLLRPA